jgi:spore coat polysaccharide biosynthesis protein SpsF (cytidylyltransferase family)
VTEQNRESGIRYRPNKRPTGARQRAGHAGCPVCTLERSHRDGEDKERSEYCSAYPRRRSDLFHIEVVEPDARLKRLDLRYTVDYPEDLILCREAYKATKSRGPRIPIADLVVFADGNPDLQKLVAPFVSREAIWASVVGAT